MAEFARRLKEYRNARNYTQKELADILNVSQNAIYNWENGKREPSIDMITKISKALNISEQELLGFNDREYSLFKIVEERKSLDNTTVELLDETFIIGDILISDKKLLKEFHALNSIGKKEAIQRISELKYVPGYTGDDGIPFK